MADSNYITPTFPSWQHFRYLPDPKFPTSIMMIETWSTKFEYLLMSISIEAIEGTTELAITVYRVTLRIMSTLPPYNRTMSGLDPTVAQLFTDLKDATTLVHELKANAESYAVAFVL